MGYDGTNFRNAGSITFEVDGSVSTGVMPGKILFATSAAGSSNPTNRMAIDAAGNVGIGTEIPSQQFEIVASNSRKFTFNGGSTFSVGSSTAWANKYGFKSTDGTDLGGFYAYGTNTALNYFNIGAVYNDGMLAIKTDTGSIGMGTITPSAKAVLTLTSTTKGFLPPRMTETQRDAISTPPAGLIIYNTTDSKLNLYTSSWEEISSAI
jgi:hypothetical protein